MHGHMQLQAVVSCPNSTRNEPRFLKPTTQSLIWGSMKCPNTVNYLNLCFSFLGVKSGFLFCSLISLLLEG